MKRHGARLDTRFPIRSLTTLAFLTAGLVGWLGYEGYRAYRVADFTEKQSFRIEELRGVITHLDEVLTMSCRMAALTGDSAWEVRYLRFEPELDAAIREAMELAPDAQGGEAATRTDAANRKLVEMEKRAFGLIHEGRLEEARALLVSGDYESQKEIYAKGMADLGLGLRRFAGVAALSERRWAFLHVVAAVVIVAALAIAWLLLLRVMMGWRADLLNAHEESKRRSTVLDGINRALVEALKCESDDEAARACLGVAQELTNSNIGFVGEVNATGRFDTIALSNPGWDACTIPRSESAVMLKNMELRGIWSRALKEGKSQIVSDPASDPDRVGIPEGHPPLTSFLGVPLTQSGKTVGMIGLANKDSGFDAADREAVEALSVAFAEALSRKRAEQALRLDESRLEALLQLSKMAHEPLDKITNYALEEAVRLTKSQIGYLAFMSEDETVLTMHAWSKHAMKECAIADKPIVYPLEDTGLWGEAVRQRKPIITNDYLAPSPLKKGYPEGHVEVIRHMNVPIFDGERIVAVAGVGNKDRDYDDADVRQIALLMQEMWRILERKRSEEALRKHREQLEELVQQRTGELQKVNTRLEREIGEREQAETALREERNLLRTLIDSLPDYIYVKDSKSRFILNNQAHLRVLRAKTQEEILGKTDFDIFPSELAAPYYADEQTVMDSGQPLLDREEVTIDPLGRKQWLRTEKVPFRDSHGAVVGLMGISHDITARKRAEEKLDETMKELERSNKELEQFAYVASHDLQEPLRMVVSFLQLLEKRYTGKLDAAADEFIAFAVDGAKRMKKLINDLLAYSRVGTKGKPFEAVELQTVLDAALANLKVAVEQSGALVTHDALPTIVADPGQMAQLFQNLIGNAIKFHRDEAPRVHVGVEKRGGAFQFFVRDNGLGIDPKDHERIFDVFQRLHGRDEYEGTGIGLAICKKIVTRHGGSIWVESQRGTGSTFYFTIGGRGGDVS
ncbi:MAG TPA: GAF domain-containing protein [Sumerlaeia bacterium]|nr:GAF domain-containing protein [Sumerlaeia bacterium]